MGWGGCEISFCVCRRGVDRVCLGGVVKISFMSTNNYVYKYLSNSKRTIRNIVVFVTIYICTINLFLIPRPWSSWASSPFKEKRTW